MSLYDDWKDYAGEERAQAQQNAFWQDYFNAEKNNYAKILNDHGNKPSGKLCDLAESFGMTSVVFTGFLDGINDSLKKPLKLEKLKEDTSVMLDIDFEKLFFNMHEAKATWLYTLKEWEGVLSQEKRACIAKEWRISKQAVSERTVGRNDPCPCGSGKKYKHCCGV